MYTRNYENTRVVFKYSVARKLLNVGYKIVDLRPQRNPVTGETDYTRCTFVFQYEDGIDLLIERLTKNKSY